MLWGKGQRRRWGIALWGLWLALGTAAAGAAFYQASRPLPASVALIPPVPGDTNLDLQVNVSDLTLAAGYFGASPLPPGAPDFNADGQINILDLALIGKNYAAEVRQ